MKEKRGNRRSREKSTFAENFKVWKQAYLTVYHSI